MGAQPSPPLPTGSRRRWPVALLLVAIALAVAAIAAFLLLRDSPPPGSSAATVAPTSTLAPPATTRPAGQGFSKDAAAAAYAAIQKRRDEAYAKVDESILRAIYAPSCACLARDLQDLNLQRRNGYHFAGPPTRVRRVRVTSLDPAAKTAFVVAEVNYGAARYTDSSGNLRYVEKDKGWQTAQTILVWDGRRWRVAAVVDLR